MRILLNKYQLFKLKAVYNVLKMITSRYEWKWERCYF